MTGSFGGMIAGVLSLNAPMAIEAGRDLFLNTPRLLWVHQRWFLVLYGLTALVSQLSMGPDRLSRLSMERSVLLYLSGIMHPLIYPRLERERPGRRIGSVASCHGKGDPVEGPKATTPPQGPILLRPL